MSILTYVVEFQMSDPPSQITADFTKAISFTAYHTLATVFKEATDKTFTAQCLALESHSNQQPQGLHVPTMRIEILPLCDRR
jgi:hypothetical protein